MEIIKLSYVAKHGVKNAKIVKPNDSPQYKELVRIANSNILMEQQSRAKVYIRAKNYVAKSNNI